MEKFEDDRQVKPIHFIHTPGITTEEKKLALETLAEILEIANVKEKTSITDLGVWREPNYRDSSGNLIPHMSIDWYVEKTHDRERGQIDAYQLLDQISLSQTDRESRITHYNIILTDLDLHNRVDMFGLGHAGLYAAIVSVNRSRKLLDRRMKREVDKQLIYHEAGHAFGLPNPLQPGVVHLLGEHCTNICAMRQGGPDINNWVRLARDKYITGQVYCNPCTEQLRRTIWL